jgi:signal transduction histidine kinase
MTVYHARSERAFLRDLRLRPTLRLRLTLVSAVFLVVSAILLIVLAWLLVGDAVGGASQLPDGSQLFHADGSIVDTHQWQDELLSSVRADLLVDGLLAALGLSMVGGAGAYWFAGRALRPLQQVTSTAQHLSGETLDQRIRYVGADDEVAELAATFDAMLDRINTTFETQKRFVANASHELRTPLAVMRTEIDVTLADPEADIAEYRRMAKVVRDGSERANALVEALLVLARSEAQAGRRLSRKMPADLMTGVAAALAATRKEAEKLSLRVETTLEPAPVVGDPGLLDRLAGNLIENAVRYNHLHGRLWVRTGADEAHAWLVVGNTGYEVEPPDVPGLFEPFRRGGWERTGGRGSGLGLSIVRAVAEAHGGTVGATANASDGGLEVTVRLPAAVTTPIAAGTAAVWRP